MIGTRLSMPKDAAHDLYAVAPRDVTASGDKSFQGTDLWSEVSFFVMAGGIMVSTLMSAVFFYLTRHTDMYTRLATEIRTTFISGEAVVGGSTPRTIIRIAGSARRLGLPCGRLSCRLL